MPCQNDGICHDMIYSFRCSCPKGTTGMLCEINEPDCFDSACHHGGTCVDKVHFLETSLIRMKNRKYLRVRPYYYTLYVINFFQVGGYECQCPAGYVGPRCEGDVNECLSNPCSELGTQSCVQLVNDYRLVFI